MASVLSGSARVLIATLLMVPEMTGDFKILLPAALAVMASYFLQVSLSAHVRYQSLLEFQVPARHDSPAHRAEQLEIAFRLLEQLPVPPSLGPIELTSLLTSGVPVGIPGGRNMRLGVLRGTSACVGKPIRVCSLGSSADGVELLLALREAEVIWPNPDAAHRAGNRLLVIVSDAAWTLLCNRDLTDPAASALA
jgi:hypothetical protein